MNIEKRGPLHKVTYLPVSFVMLLMIVHAPYLAGFETQRHSSKAIGMSNAVTACPIGSMSLFYNPAALSFCAEREVSIYYSPAPFGIGELKTAALGYLEPTPLAQVGFGFRMSGFSLYKETIITGGFACALEEFRIGFSFHYYHLFIDRYGSASTLGIDVGLAHEILDGLTIGTVLTNVNNPRIGSVRERLPVVWSMGLAYTIDESLTLGADIQKETRYPETIRVGLEYSPIRFVRVRVGHVTEPARFSAGIGIQYETLSFDYSLWTHEDLGASHSVGVTISLGPP